MRETGGPRNRGGRGAEAIARPVEWAANRTAEGAQAAGEKAGQAYAAARGQAGPSGAVWGVPPGPHAARVLSALLSPCPRHCAKILSCRKRRRKI